MKACEVTWRMKVKGYLKKKIRKVFETEENLKKMKLFHRLNLPKGEEKNY